MARHSIAPTPSPIPGLGSGWVTFASWNTGGATISQVSTTWAVPPDPSSGDMGQTVFLFNGLQNGTGSSLLQPVLQWGASQAGGGPYWSIGNWYIDDSGHVSHSDVLQVLPGEVLTGIVALGQESNGECSYSIGFDGHPNLDLNVSGVDPALVAVEVLESYQIGNCNEYPATASTSMSLISIAASGAAPTVVWDIETNSPSCGEQTIVITQGNPDGELEIRY